TTCSRAARRGGTRARPWTGSLAQRRFRDHRDARSPLRVSRTSRRRALGPRMHYTPVPRNRRNPESSPSAVPVHIHSKAEIDKMRAAGRLAGRVLEYIEPFVQPGVTTGKLDELCHAFILRHGAIPAPLNYKGFPKSICTSVNEAICHGIPGDRVPVESDNTNIHITVSLDECHGATSALSCTAEVSDRATRLNDV